MSDVFITLGWTQHLVPVMALRQNRLLQPIFHKIVAKILNDGVSLTDLTDDDVGALADMCFIAASKGSPDLTRDALEDMPITVRELVDALLPVMQQSGLYTPKDEAPGETQGETSPPTGTQ